MLRFLLPIAVSLLAHSGGQDDYGCHTDAAAGNYHCHSGSRAGRTFASKEEMLRGSAPAMTAPKSEAGGDFKGKVVGVLDGDTIEVMRGGRAVRIRLHGVDCPEKRQPYGAAAKKFASGLAFGKDVRVIVKDTDRYGRVVAQILLPDGRMLHEELVKAGLAWWYRRYDPDNPRLAGLERAAQEVRAGLWAESDPTAPWAFRRKEKFAGP